jgi:hypothetical protein
VVRPRVVYPRGDLNRGVRIGICLILSDRIPAKVANRHPGSTRSESVCHSARTLPNHTVPQTNPPSMRGGFANLTLCPTYLNSFLGASFLSDFACLKKSLSPMHRPTAGPNNRRARLVASVTAAFRAFPNTIGRDGPLRRKRAAG